MQNIYEIAKKAGIAEEFVIPYGLDKAKIDLRINDSLPEKQGKLVLVTAITPTKAGEGKTTTSIALTDGMNAIGVKSLLCLRVIAEFLSCRSTIATTNNGESIF